MNEPADPSQQPASPKAADSAAGSPAPAPVPASAASSTAPPPPADDAPASATAGPQAIDKRFFVRIALQTLGLFVAAIALLVMLGLAQRQGWIGANGGMQAVDGGENGVIYSCPMHPQIRQPSPGRCPICGMPLEPITSTAGAREDEFAVRIDPAARRLANIETAAVTEEPVVRTISTIGRIAADESRLATISAYIAGRIERLFADYTGVQVAKGDHLAVIYSPTLYAAQVEFIESRRSLRGMTPGVLAAVRSAQEQLVTNARQRLVELGMTKEQMAELERSGEAQSRMTIYAPQGGTVVEKLAVEGKYVEAGEPIYRIANLSTVWLLLELYPEDASSVRFGQQVRTDVQSLPGETFIGRVAFVSPVVDERTRTVAVRVEMSNEEGKLRPGDYASARISVPLGAEGAVYDADLAGKWISPMHPQIIREEPGACPICGMDLVPTSRYGYAEEPVAQPTALVAPRSAVLMAGAQSLVYVETEPGRFELRPVTLGPILRDRVVILEGLEAGEQVATSGNFLIDSQMQLAGKPSLIDPERALARKSEKKKQPLELSKLPPEPLPGEAGARLEEFYQAYFHLQGSLAADQVPTAEQVQRVEAAGTALLENPEMPAEAGERIRSILGASAHLHHLPLKEAREHFKPISQEILLLASEHRGAGSKESFVHFWCSMVPNGGGDWLQASQPPANPYWGSTMLRCTQHTKELPPAVSRAEPETDDSRKL